MTDPAILTGTVTVVAVCLIGAVMLAVRGQLIARYFLWIWAALMIVVVPVAFFVRGPILTRLDAELLIGILAVVLFVIYRYGVEKLIMSHEETRRVLVASSKGIEEERRLISHRIHDDINPNLLLCRNTLQRLQPQITGNEAQVALVAQAVLLLDTAYRDLRDLIRNLRVEVIDTIGFTAALEALVNHYSSCFEKPVLVLEHNLPRRPAIDQTVALNAFKILREALLNAIKHANAQTVRLEVQQDPDGPLFRVAIIDDGLGMNRAPRGEGIGLLDMRERAHALGTELEITEFNPGSCHPGTRVAFTFQAATADPSV